MHMVMPRYFFGLERTGAIQLGCFILLPLLFSSYFYEVREAPRAVLVLLLAVLGIYAATHRVEGWTARLSVGWMAAVALVSVSSGHLTDAWVGQFPLTHGAGIWLAYLVFLCFPRPTQEAPAWLWGLAISGAAQGALATLQSVVWRASPVGTLGHMSFLGAFAALAFVATLGCLAGESQPKRRSFLALLGLLCLAGIIASGRRSPWLSVLVGVVVLGMSMRPQRRYRTFFIAAGFIGLVSFVLYVSAGGSALLKRWIGVDGPASTTLSRLASYVEAVALVRREPWLGYGFIDFRFLHSGKQGLLQHEGRIHDAFLDLALALGLPVALLFLVLLVVAAVRVGRMVGRERDPIRVTCAAVAAAYFPHLVVNIDQPAVGAWAFACGGMAVGASVRIQDERWIQVTRGLAGVISLVSAGVICVAHVSMAYATRLESIAPRASVEVYRGIRAWVPTHCAADLRLIGLMPRDASRKARIDVLRQSVQECPRNPFVYHQLSLVLAGSDRVDDRREALRMATRAYTLAPWVSSVARGLARLLADEGRVEQAYATLSLLEREDRADGAILNDLGRLAAHLGKEDEALEYLRKAVYVEPTNPAFRANLDEALRRLQLEDKK